MWNSYKPTEEDMDAVKFCLNKGIHISLLPIANDSIHYHIEVITWTGDKPNRKKDPKIYTTDKVVEKMYEYYNWYYDKLKTKESEEN